MVYFIYNYLYLFNTILYNIDIEAYAYISGILACIQYIIYNKYINKYKITIYLV